MRADAKITVSIVFYVQIGQLNTYETMQLKLCI